MQDFKAGNEDADRASTEIEALVLGMHLDAMMKILVDEKSGFTDDVGRHLVDRTKRIARESGLPAGDGYTAREYLHGAVGRRVCGDEIAAARQDMKAIRAGLHDAERRIMRQEIPVYQPKVKWALWCYDWAKRMHGIEPHGDYRIDGSRPLDVALDRFGDFMNTSFVDPAPPGTSMEERLREHASMGMLVHRHPVFALRDKADSAALRIMGDISEVLGGLMDLRSNLRSAPVKMARPLTDAPIPPAAQFTTSGGPRELAQMRFHGDTLRVMQSSTRAPHGPDLSSTIIRLDGPRAAIEALEMAFCRGEELHLDTVAKAPAPGPAAESRTKEIGRYRVLVNNAMICVRDRPGPDGEPAVCVDWQGSSDDVNIKVQSFSEDVPIEVSARLATDGSKIWLKVSVEREDPDTSIPF